MAWRIISSKKIDQDYGKICLRAYGDGRLHDTLEAMKHVRQQLTSDPLAAGEPKHRLKYLNLLLCVIIRRPLVIHYALDELRQWVYLRSIVYLQR